LPNIFKSKRHDTAISPVVVLTPPPGLDWDLQTSGVTAKLIARLPGAVSPKISRAAVVTGPWEVRFDPLAADVDTIGAYDVEVEATRSDGKKITLPTEGFLSWVIGADLDDA
jgi:hypothetical protein